METVVTIPSKCIFYQGIIFRYIKMENIAVITNDWHFREQKLFLSGFMIKDDKDPGGYNFVFVNLKVLKIKIWMKRRGMHGLKRENH